METILGSFLSFLLLYKYTALFVVSFFAAFLLPLPSSSTLAGSGAFASQGYFSLAMVLFVALLGNIGGDLAGYFLARRYGEEFMRKIGFKKVFSSRYYKSVVDYLTGAPHSLIFFSRFLPEVGPAVNILAGITGVPVRTFLVVDIIGEVSYVLLYGLVGFFMGSGWENNMSFLVEGGMVMLSLGIVMALIQYLLFRAR